MDNEVEKLKQKIKELERKVKISKQSLEQYALIKKKHKEALEILHKQRHFTSSIIESNQNAIIAINKNKRVVIYNNRAEQIFGFTKKEMLNKDSLHKIIPPKFLDKHNNAVDHFLKTKESIGIINNKVELEAIRKDGTTFPIRISFGVDIKDDDITIVANMDDISTEIKQQQTIQQQSKLVAMGEMIGAIAHQWRQPLNEIGISIQTIRYDFQHNMVDEEYINEFIFKNKNIIKFMSKTIDNFRNFFRIDKEKKEFSIKEATQAVIDMQLAQLTNHNIAISLIGKDFPIYGFYGEYQQVILNLINNAKDALLENRIREPSIQVILNNKKIIIQDNAGGIPKKIFENIFDPYFTTKEQSKGTGMGLYISKMIIEENMGGHLFAQNTKDGATFVIDLL